MRNNTCQAICHVQPATSSPLPCHPSTCGLFPLWIRSQCHHTWPSGTNALSNEVEGIAQPRVAPRGNSVSKGVIWKMLDTSLLYPYWVISLFGCCKNPCQTSWLQLRDKKLMVVDFPEEVSPTTTSVLLPRFTPNAMCRNASHDEAQSADPGSPKCPGACYGPALPTDIGFTAASKSRWIISVYCVIPLREKKTT